MHIGEDIDIVQQFVKQPVTVIAVDELKEHAVFCEFVEIRPDFQHSAGFKVKDIVHLFTGFPICKIIEPPGKRDSYFESFIAAGIAVHVTESHECLVDIVVGSPYLFAPCNPVKVFFGNGRSPETAVFLLAAVQLMDNVVCLGEKFLVTVFKIPHCACAQVMTEKMTAKLTGRVLPSGVRHIFASEVLIHSGFLIEILQQRGRFQLIQITSVVRLFGEKFAIS